MPGSLPGKPPPYTYDDPRLIYDELCLTYDGDVDQQCVINNFGVKKFGGNFGRKRKPLPDLLDIKIEVCLCKVNEEDLYCDEESISQNRYGKCDTLRWKGLVNDGDLQVNTRGIEVTSRTSVNGYVLSQLASTTSESDKKKNEHIDARGAFAGVRKLTKVISEDDIVVGGIAVVADSMIEAIEQNQIKVEASSQISVKRDDIKVEAAGGLIAKTKKKKHTKPYLREQTITIDDVVVKSTGIKIQKKKK